MTIEFSAVPSVFPLKSPSIADSASCFCLADQNALAGGEAIGFDHHRQVKERERFQRLGLA